MNQLDIDSLLITARQRQHDQALHYAGAVTPIEAFALLQSDPDIKLVDVRTQAERDWVGHVALPELQQLAIQWSLYPGGTVNQAFMEQLVKATRPNDVLLFLCRSGVRSRHAARLATENGYVNCFDILEGMEGDRDENGHRKMLAGWCKAGLPWVGA
jgi:rhodanese-related sulfurtransferase